MNTKPLKYVHPTTYSSVADQCAAQYQAIADLTVPTPKSPTLSESNQTRLFALFLGALALFMIGWLGAMHRPDQPMILSLLQLLWGSVFFVLLLVSVLQLATTD